MLFNYTDNPQNKITENDVAGASLLFYIGQNTWKIFRFLLMLCLTFIILYPLVYMVSMAFRDVKDVYDPTIVWIPRNLTVSNFSKVIEVTKYFESLKNTVIISVVSSILQIFTCALTGYGLARFKFKGRGILMIVLLFTIIVPPQLVSLPTFLMFKDFDILGILTLLTGHGSGISLINSPFSFFSLAVLGQGIRSGLFILIFRQFFLNMPAELEDAAMVDGCGFTKIYFKIMLPNARVAFFVVFLFSLVWYWNDFYMTAIYLDAFPTVSTKLSGLRGSFELAMQSSAFDPYQIVTMEQAACLLTILPLLVLYLFTQKQFIESIERTGIVG